ncbi:hypothetical protein GCM10022286_17210 [Gryllotalpicola daejeonensis]|uniref:DUF1795 domain-containing protein n=1 Tax=Gryllotalpicola daejeonensis TaxID=993087 RepID=A0ABP7ZJV7_9MICO
MSLAQAVPRTLAGFTVMLPGTWEIIPMTTEDEVRARVSALVKRQLPKADRLASLRRDARERTLEAALGALKMDAVAFAMALEMLPGVPFGASLIGFAPGWPPAAPEGDDGVVGRLRRALPQAEVFEHALGAMGRYSTVVTEQAGEQEFPALDLEYWIARDGGQPIVFMVSIPMSPDDRLMTEFFDAVMDSIRWTEEP